MRGFSSNCPFIIILLNEQSEGYPLVFVRTWCGLNTYSTDFNENLDTSTTAQNRDRVSMCSKPHLTFQNGDSLKKLYT